MSQMFASKRCRPCEPFKGQATLLSEGPQLACHLTASSVSEKWLLRNTSNAPLEMRPSVAVSHPRWQRDRFLLIFVQDDELASGWLEAVLEKQASFVFFRYEFKDFF